jgi:hypothetical protein
MKKVSTAAAQEIEKRLTRPDIVRDAMFHQLTTIAYQVAASITSSLPTVLNLSNFGPTAQFGNSRPVAAALASSSE